MGKIVGIGIIGLGGISKKHIKELCSIEECRITAVCDIDEKKLNAVGEELKIPTENRFTDYRELISCTDVDAVEICTPNHLHVQMAIEAVEAGKPINVEKPLSVDYGDALLLGKKLLEKPVDNMMCFSYRFMPAVRYAKRMMENGEIGKVLNIQVEYLKSSAFMKGRRLEWRFIKKYAGTGVLGDLGVHLVDMASFLFGDIKAISAAKGIVVKQRKLIDSEETGEVETDDWCSFMAEIGDGINGNFFITRCALGHVNTIKFDVFGEKGMISFNLNTPEVIYVNKDVENCDKGSLECITVPDEFKIMQEQMFVDMVNKKECQYLPTVADGIKMQKVIDAILESSEKHAWVEL